MLLTWSSLEELGITRGPTRRTMLKYRVASNMQWVEDLPLAANGPAVPAMDCPTIPAHSLAEGWLLSFLSCPLRQAR